MANPSHQSSTQYLPHALPIHLCFRIANGGAGRHVRIKRSRTRSAGDGGSQGSSGISEDVLARLRLAEDEAIKLREELAKAKAAALERVRNVANFSLPERK